LTGPGGLVDVVVTARSIAINLRRGGLLDTVKGSGLPIRDIRDIQREVEQICGGKPTPPRRSGQVVAAVKWVDGTVLDSVWKVER
jgi:citrate lyase subunit alpha / citrate CoA-transferase